MIFGIYQFLKNNMPISLASGISEMLDDNAPTVVRSLLQKILGRNRC